MCQILHYSASLSTVTVHVLHHSTNTDAYIFTWKYYGPIGGQRNAFCHESKKVVGITENPKLRLFAFQSIQITLFCVTVEYLHVKRLEPPCGDTYCVQTLTGIFAVVFTNGKLSELGNGSSVRLSTRRKPGNSISFW